MNKKGPIVVIEDDEDDRELLNVAFRELAFGNEVKFFSLGIEAYNYLQARDVHPFLILSDVNMPQIDGFELRQMIGTNEQLVQKCIPYLFFSTNVCRKSVTDAYLLSAQGFFLKPNSYQHLLSTLRTIVEYWRECYSPASYYSNTI